MVTLLLVCSSLDQAVLVRAMAGDIVLYSYSALTVSYTAFTVPLSTLVDKCVCWRITLTSILSRGE